MDRSPLPGQTTLADCGTSGEEWRPQDRCWSCLMSFDPALLRTRLVFGRAVSVCPRCARIRQRENDR